jgi:hypothetical protein
MTEKMTTPTQNYLQWSTQVITGHLLQDLQLYRTKLKKKRKKNWMLNLSERKLCQLRLKKLNLSKLLLKKFKRQNKNQMRCMRKTWHSEKPRDSHLMILSQSRTGKREWTLLTTQVNKETWLNWDRRSKLSGSKSVIPLSGSTKQLIKE